jgi:rhodanese-related sulfurtransferase
MIKHIRPTDLFMLRQESGAITVIDVREPDEFQIVSTTFSENVPLSTFDAAAIAEKFGKQTSLYLLCRSGRRSYKAAELLAAAGCTALYNVDGGILEWEAEGLPVVRG